MDLITGKTILEKKTKIIYNKKIKRAIFSNTQLTGKKFYFCDLSDITLENCDLTDCAFENCLLDGISLKNSNLTRANLKSASLRHCNLENCNLSGAYLYGAILENANLKNIKIDNKTRWFELYCPEQGSFLGYKKAVEDRLITLLIMDDSLRTSATKNSCRTNKAKVLKITNFDESINYDIAWSLADENFCYKVGEVAFVTNFNKNRWFESTTGIHFWLTKEEAKKY